MTGLQGFVDHERAVLRMEGAEVRAVLQNTVTNDIGRLAPGRAVYAALLTPQGKYLFDFLLVEAADGAVLVDTPAARAEALGQRLKMYCLRRDARIGGAAGLGVALAWGGAPAAAGDAIVVPDPRNPALGWRLYAADPAAALAAAGAAQASPAAWQALRVAHLVPESGVELVPEQTFILEANFEALNGVDLKKGCFVGQEVTARMKHKTELRRRLVQVRVEGRAPPGTPVTAGGRPAGTLFTQADGRGLAHLRLDRAQGPLDAGAARLTYEG
ncbi:MAG TPA: folate-binding protein [Thermohalobaculum sp.]|nr:folate-binding protein [Thermohalobaculum sp.]